MGVAGIPREEFSANYYLCCGSESVFLSLCRVVVSEGGGSAVEGISVEDESASDFFLIFKISSYLSTYTCTSIFLMTQ